MSDYQLHKISAAWSFSLCIHAKVTLNTLAYPLETLTTVYIEGSELRPQGGTVVPSPKLKEETWR
jgi:hypothetical protein